MKHEHEQRMRVCRGCAHAYDVMTEIFGSLAELADDFEHVKNVAFAAAAE